MHSLRVSNFSSGDDVVVKEVTLRRQSRTDAVFLVGQIEIVGSAVRLTENGNRFDAEFATGSDNSQGNFPAVGDQNALKHAKLKQRKSGNETRYGKTASTETRCWRRPRLESENQSDESPMTDSPETQKSVRLNAEQNLARFNRVTVGNEHLLDSAADICGNLVKDFHGLDDTDNRILSNLRTGRDKHRIFRRR